MQRTYSLVSATIFGLVALLQLARAIGHWPMQIGSTQIPVFASWIAFAVAGCLCLWGFGSAPRARRR